jgi:NYN domain
MARLMDDSKQHAVYVFWDHSNIFVAGRAYAERTEGFTFGAGVRIHFKNLIRLALANRQAGRVICIGSAADPQIEKLLRDTGAEVELYERGASSGREQGVDQCLQVHMLRAALDVKPPGVAVLLSGDGAGYGEGTGFHADLRRLHLRGWGIEVLSWKHSCGRTLRSWVESVGVFVPIDNYYRSVTFVTDLRNVDQLSLKNRAKAIPVVLDTNEECHCRYGLTTEFRMNRRI